MKLYFNGREKEKICAYDFLGTIIIILGVTGDDIGIIKIQGRETYIDILNGKGPLVLAEVKEKTAKGKKLKAHKAKR